MRCLVITALIVSGCFSADKPVEMPVEAAVEPETAEPQVKQAAVTSKLEPIKLEAEDCRFACQNFHTIMFWDKYDKEAKNLSPEAAASLRAERELEFQENSQRQNDQGLMNCVANCQSEATAAQVNCMQEATTAAVVQACL